MEICGAKGLGLFSKLVGLGLRIQNLGFSKLLSS